jgi:hypothetical protein
MAFGMANKYCRRWQRKAFNSSADKQNIMVTVWLNGYDAKIQTDAGSRMPADMYFADEQGDGMFILFLRKINCCKIRVHTINENKFSKSFSLFIKL